MSAMAECRISSPVTRAMKDRLRCLDFGPRAPPHDLLEAWAALCDRVAGRVDEAGWPTRDAANSDG